MTCFDHSKNLTAKSRCRNSRKRSEQMVKKQPQRLKTELFCTFAPPPVWVYCYCILGEGLFTWPGACSLIIPLWLYGRSILINTTSTSTCCTGKCSNCSCAVFEVDRSMASGHRGSQITKNPLPITYVVWTSWQTPPPMRTVNASIHTTELETW